jgi:DNA-directed RNA polymerase subunit RPC12/RpoP
MTPAVCAVCNKPLSMAKDAVSRRKDKRPEDYRCQKCHRWRVAKGMSSTGSERRKAAPNG